MTVIWAREAIVDLARIRAHIAEDNPVAANRIAKRLLDISAFLADQPNMGVATAVSDVRRLVVPQSVYSLIYRLVGDQVEIIEVFDGRRKMPRTPVAR
ncbi:plasmid stabilization system protein ParE [Neorhizobium huautlense]|uniref:Plasmid stabilization system protein ParE n=1 Tax=Neorhizobium huautlense TaxID=67774 RepID=A0ABT9PPX0_9HYPH|nr:type II toxin-antitoxin system RelE/ParE family toxin [Neorhizobium huautlense]MDP9836178.1 plasmid stabilization system protein ParE [Neorhizobium huautlense]